jgi:hypothetical protein
VARLRRPGAFQRLRADMESRTPSSCRRLAALLDIDKMTAWRWRHKILGTLLDTTATPPDDIAETKTRQLRESRKGSREWTLHCLDPATFPTPDRPRWVDVDRHGLPLPLPFQAYQATILIFTGPTGRLATRVHPAARTASPASHPPPKPLLPRTTHHLDHFLRPFRGPAEKYLDRYAAWFASRQNNHSNHIIRNMAGSC